MTPNPELAKGLQALAEEIERITREHFQDQLKRTVRELAIQKRARELQRRGKAKKWSKRR